MSYFTTETYSMKRDILKFSEKICYSSDRKD